MDEIESTWNGEYHIPILSPLKKQWFHLFWWKMTSSLFFFFYEKDKFYKTDLLRVFGYNGEKTLSIVWLVQKIIINYLIPNNFMNKDFDLWKQTSFFFFFFGVICKPQMRKTYFKFRIYTKN